MELNLSRKAAGAEVLKKAKGLAARAETASELRMALAVVLPVEFGWSLEQVAGLVGKSVSWVSRSRREIIERDAAPNSVVRKGHGGRRNQLMNPEEELSFMVDFFRSYAEKRQLGIGSAAGGFSWTEWHLPFPLHVKAALEKRSGRPVSLATTYNIMRRTYVQKFGTVGSWPGQIYKAHLI